MPLKNTYALAGPIPHFYPAVVKPQEEATVETQLHRLHRHVCTPQQSVERQAAAPILLHVIALVIIWYWVDRW